MCLKHPSETCVLLAPISKEVGFFFINIPMQNRAMFFVDGFNLYHAIAGVKAIRKYKWLNLHKLCSSFLSSRETLSKIFFFTAYYPGSMERRQKHQMYIRALELHDVVPVLGEFKRKDKYCSNCGKSFPGYEEKQTDVNIAIELFKQAVNDSYDTAFILSGDSDLIPAIRAVKSTFPNKVNEFVFKTNTNGLPAFDVDGSDCGITAVRAYVAGMEGRRLTYKDLKANAE